MLSIIIPSRNEKYLAKTVADIFAKALGKIEVIVVLDEKDQKLNPRSHLIVHKKIGRPGMESAINQGVKLASGKYIMKIDAHCMFGKGFDKILTSACEDNWVIIPRRYSLIPDLWQVNPRRPAVDYEYFVLPWLKDTCNIKTWSERAAARKELLIDENMAFQGSCWLTTRKHFRNIGGFDIYLPRKNGFGLESWEIANKTWLSGGKVMVNKRTWYAHLHKGKQCGRGYTLDKRIMRQQREFHNDYWLHDQWPKAIHKMSWLIEQFWPIPGWPEDWQEPKYEQAYRERESPPHPCPNCGKELKKEIVTKAIIYYTDNRLHKKIMKRCQEQLRKVESSTLPIVSVSLKPIEFGQNYVLDLERGYLTVTKQIIKALEESPADVVFFCEHDVLYHPSHFDFTPAKKDVFYYNMNSWMLRAEDGHALYYDHRSLSGMCCFRETALEHFKKRKERIEALLQEAGDTGLVKAVSGNTIPLKEGIHRLGFEPGTHNRPERIDDLQAESWRSEFPNVDIRHRYNLTQNRFRKDQFRNARSYQGWTEADEIPGWGKGKDLINKS